MEVNGLRRLNKLFVALLRLIVIVFIGGVLTSNLISYTFSANTTDSPNVLITINGDGSISQAGNLFDGQLYPSTVSDAENGIGGINGVIRIQNQFRKVDVDNLAVGIKNLVIGNNYPRDVVFNSFLQNVKLKIEKGVLLSFDKTLIEYISLDNILYEKDNDEYRGYALDASDRFSINKGDSIDLKYSLHMDIEAGNELQSVTAYMPIYINLKGSYIDDDDNDDDGDDDEIIEDSEVPAGVLNKSDHFQYIQGYPDDTVRPEGLITREEVSAVFYRLLESNYRMSVYTEKADFHDVENDRWSARYIATLFNGKIIEGYPNGSFKPGAPITRAELATIASKFDGLSFLESNFFSDADIHWAVKYINSAAAKGWVQGYPDNTFKPDQYITRAEFVTLVNNVLGRRVHRDYILKDVKSFPDLSETMWYYEAMIEAINSHLYDWNEDLSSEIWIEIIYPNLDL